MARFPWREKCCLSTSLSQVSRNNRKYVAKAWEINRGWKPLVCHCTLLVQAKAYSASYRTRRNCINPASSAGRCQRAASHTCFRKICSRRQRLSCFQLHGVIGMPNTCPSIYAVFFQASIHLSLEDQRYSFDFVSILSPSAGMLRGSAHLVPRS